MASANKLPGRVEFGKARLSAFGDLDNKSALDQQRKIAGSDVLLKVSIQDPKTSDALRSRLVYYYKEAATYYYQSNSNDIAKLTGEILPQLIELEEDIRNDTQLHNEFHKAPLLDIINKANENIKIKASFSNRIATKARKVLDLPVGGVIAAAATKSPLIGLAVAAYEFSRKNKPKPTGSTVFHKEQALDEKLLERSQLEVDDTSAPVSSEDLIPRISKSSKSKSTGIDYASDDAELKAYVAGMKPGDVTPLTSWRNQGAGGQINLSPITAILNKHTNLLGGTYRNSKAIVSILQGNSLKEEEALGEGIKSATKISGTGTKTGPGGFLSNIMSVFTSLGPKLMAAVAGVLPTLAVALPALIKTALVGTAAFLGSQIGTAISEFPPIKMILDWLGDIGKNNEKNKANALAASNDGQVMQYKKERGIGSDADLRVSFAKDRQNSLMPKMGVIPDSVFDGVKSGASSSPVAASAASMSASSTPAPAAAPSSPSAAPVAKNQDLSKPQDKDLPIDYDAYSKAVGARESSNNYKAENSLGFLGKYQFGAAALEDLGLIKKGTFKKYPNEDGKNKKIVDDPNNWVSGNKETFLNDHELQERSMHKYTKMNYKSLVRLGKIKKDSSATTIAGWLGASHLLGPGVKDLSKQDAYGTKGGEYYALGFATQQMPARPSTGSISLASTNSDLNQSGRRELTSAVSQAPASNASMPPVIFNTNNQNTSMVGGGGARSQGIAAPVDNSPVVRQLVGS